MKKIIVIGFVFALFFGLIACNPFNNKINIEFHLHPPMMLNSQVINFKVGDITGDNFPIVKSAEPSTYTVEWTTKNKFVDLENNYKEQIKVTDDDDGVKFYIYQGQIIREEKYRDLIDSGY